MSTTPSSNFTKGRLAALAYVFALEYGLAIVVRVLFPWLSNAAVFWLFLGFLAAALVGARLIVKYLPNSKQLAF